MPEYAYYALKERGKEPQRTTLPCFTNNVIRVELTKLVQIGEYVHQNCTHPHFTDTAIRAKLTELNLFLVWSKILSV